MKRPTQLDVARAAGVSRATVSFVINDSVDNHIPISEETRQRVFKAVEELGYIPDARAQSLRSGDSKTIGFIIPDLNNPHYWENTDGIVQAARAAGYTLLLSSMELSLKYQVDIFKDLAGRRIDGLILTGTFIDRSDEASQTLAHLLKQKRGLALVEVSDRPNNDIDIDCVISDYRTATNEAMTHLISLQHKRIGMVLGAEPAELAFDRYEPYKACLQAAGLPFDPNLVAYCGPTLEDGYQAGLLLLKHAPRPTAILAINDLMAMGVLRAAADLGLRVPADFSLVGFDNIFAAPYMVPRLTTVSKDPVHLGKEAVRMLINRIQNPNLPRQNTYISARLIFRESTGPAPADDPAMGHT